MEDFSAAPPRTLAIAAVTERKEAAITAAGALERLFAGAAELEQDPDMGWWHAEITVSTVSDVDALLLQAEAAVHSELGSVPFAVTTGERGEGRTALRGQVIGDIEHAGHTGRVFFDPEANILYGRVSGIGDVVTFGGRTVDESRREFVESVEEYREMCAGDG